MPQDHILEVQRTVTGFYHELGAELVEYGPNRTVLSLTLEPKHLNNASNLHGGVTASLMDVAMGLCGTFTENHEERRVAITLSLNVNFSAVAGNGAQVRAVATCRKAGHKIFMASCDLFDQDDNLLGFGEGVFKKGVLRRDLP